MRVVIRVGHHENVKKYTLDADYMNYDYFIKEGGNLTL